MTWINVAKKIINEWKDENTNPNGFMDLDTLADRIADILNLAASDDINPNEVIKLLDLIKTTQESKQ